MVSVTVGKAPLIVTVWSLGPEIRDREGRKVTKKFLRSRTSYIVFRAQCKTKIQVPCSIINRDFKMVIAEYLSMEPSKCGALCYTPMKLPMPRIRYPVHTRGTRVSWAHSGIMTDDIQGLFPRELPGLWALPLRTHFLMT